MSRFLQFGISKSGKDVTLMYYHITESYPYSYLQHPMNKFNI